jgi:hypothetical protein
MINVETPSHSSQAKKIITTKQTKNLERHTPWFIVMNSYVKALKEAQRGKQLT